MGIGIATGPVLLVGAGGQYLILVGTGGGYGVLPNILVGGTRGQRYPLVGDTGLLVLPSVLDQYYWWVLVGRSTHWLVMVGSTQFWWVLVVNSYYRNTVGNTSTGGWY